MIIDFAEQMRLYALEHPLLLFRNIDKCYSRDYEYNEETTIQCVLTVNIIDKQYGWQLLINNKDQKTDLPNDVVKEFLNAFFENREVFELPRFPIFKAQRRFIVIEFQNCSLKKQ